MQFPTLSSVTRKRIHITCIVLFFIAIICGLITIREVNIRKTNNKKNRFGISATELGNFESWKTTPSPDYCGIEPKSFFGAYVRVTSVDAANGVVKISTTMAPCGLFVGEFDDYSVTTSQNITLNYNNAVMVYKSGQVMTDQSGIVAIDADVNNYPFDEFSFSFVMRGTYGAAQRAVPVLALLYGAPMGYSLSFDPIANDDNTVVVIAVSGKRNLTVKTFAVIIMAGMWAMALLAVAVAHATWVSGKKVELPVIVFSITLLFAMPTVRNAMPNAPAIGILADQMVLGWTMMLLSLTVVSNFVNLLYHLHADAQK
ncbi:hypothetical protein HDU79_003592 [Rhizoclosmatium sp. JEL0117]|nr:hypothetical protein HDU79_003592 [Rhizoclosmatium sp. JEL0117]